MSGATLSTEISENDGVPLVQAHGEIDLRTVSEFENALRTGIERGTPALIVDLSDISYLDSAGLGALVFAYRELSARDGVLYVVAPPDRVGVRRVLEITRLDNMIRVRDSVADARREIKLPRAA